MKLKYIFVIILILLVYSVLIEPNLITVKKITLKSKDIQNLRIVFVSDFHLSKFAFWRLNRIVHTVNAQKPDIIISGGDYVILHRAKFSMDITKIAKQLSKMKTKYGFYSVLGNHDSYKDGAYIKAALLQENINVLENSSTPVEINGKTLYVAGISDMQTTHYNLEKALKDTSPPVILVSHSPDIMPQAQGRAELLLAGHTHGGQIRIPFYGAVIVPSKYGKRFESGFIDNFMYVSKGLGTSLFKMRFNCPPEITVIDYI